MKLEYCMPREVQKAQKDNTPLVIVGGTVEYHGSHCAYGCDGTIAEKLIERVNNERVAAKKDELIVAPTIWYSPSSYAVGDKTSGTVHIPERAFEDYVYYVFKSYLYIGFKNIYVVIHHQFEQENLMPMTLCYNLAAKRATMDYLQETKGEGWWGSENYKNYYSELEGANNPFAWIKIIPTMTAEVQSATGYDHAGKYETSLLMHLCPQAVDLNRLKDRPHWYTDSAREASDALGKQMANLTVESLKNRIV